MRTCLSCLFLLAAPICLAVEPPKVLDERLSISLFAAEPDIVTPVGATVDAKGRLLVVESHTHFPPEGYPGPKTDRLRWIEDTDGDGKADRFRSFYEGGHATMSLRAGAEGWIYVATRNRIFRLRDSNADDQADQEEEITRLETKGNYPHNGLGGLAFDGQGRLLFGIGENLGEPYRIVGADGAVQAGGGEGGNIYRCDARGHGLERLATGFWNPFGLCVDPFGRIFEVGNDPDSRPPCRLAHVVPGGDYGYAFRYGRSGLHPLQAWNGELPGTLPMAAGTGEAPCNVLPWHGQLWVSVWGDYRIERYGLVPEGASFRTTMDVAVQGKDDFRPVDFAPAPDGALFVTDWVDKSYPVHRKGRIWRLTWKEAPPKDLAFPPLSPAEEKAKVLAESVDLEALKDPDPFLRQAAVWGLAHSPKRAEIAWDRLTEPGQRLGLLQANRWRAAETEATGEELLPKALADADPAVRLYAVRWIADRKLTRFRKDLDGVLASPGMTPALFQGTLAARQWLDSGGTEDDQLLEVINDSAKPSELRALALRLMPPAGLKIAMLLDLAKETDAGIHREAVRSLALSTDEGKAAPLEALIRDEKQDMETRADAFLGLPMKEAEAAESYLSTAQGPLLREVKRWLAPPPGEPKPANTNQEEWAKLLAEKGDPRAGWRVFFAASAAGCGACHAVEGRGNRLGPDLTGAGRRMTRERLIDSILQPSREIAPRYVPWTVALRDGQTVFGFAAHQTEKPGTESYAGADGKLITVATKDVVSRQAAAFSVMPAGLELRMSVADFRDLLAFLEES